MKVQNKLFLIVTLLVLASCGPTPSSSSNSESSHATSNITSDSISSEVVTSSPITSAITTEAPTSEVVTTSPSPSTSQAFNGYYNSVNLNSEGTTLLNALKTLVNANFISGSYDNAWNVLKIADQDVANTNNIIQIYSRFTRPKTEQNNGGSNDTWNREHVTTQSAMNCKAPAVGPCTDYANLWASDSTVNATRGNLKFGVVTGGSIVKDSKGRETPARISGSIFDPNSEARGEVARVTFYMIIKWNFSTSINGNLNTLLEWNRQYPPTEAREIKRNNAVYNAQNNRNPFIDYPELADAIWA